MLLACEVSRPEGAYLPRVERVDAGADSDEDIYEDLPPAADDDGDDVNDSGGGDDEPDDERDDAGAARDDGGDEPAPDAEANQPGVSALLGDYWMRADVSTTATISALTMRITTTTDTEVYSLVRVYTSSGKLKFADFQCALRISQSCRNCTSISTELYDPAKSGRAFLPAVRDLTVEESGAFRTTMVPYALGWKGDFGTSPSATLPTRESDPLVYNPDGGGAGVDITVRLKPNAIVPEQTCNLRVVQKIAVSYSGMLVDGSLREGAMKDEGSAQNVISPACNGGGTSDAPTSSPATIRLIPAKAPIDPQARPWACPSLSDFRAAFD